jgi:hypothetical protein
MDLLGLLLFIELWLTAVVLLQSPKISIFLISINMKNIVDMILMICHGNIVILNWRHHIEEERTDLISNMEAVCSLLPFEWIAKILGLTAIL